MGSAAGSSTSIAVTEKPSACMRVLGPTSLTATSRSRHSCREIAAYPGLTVETLSRSFTTLRQHGTIAASDPHHIELLDSDRVRALAEARA